MDDAGVGDHAAQATGDCWPRVFSGLSSVFLSALQSGDLWLGEKLVSRRPERHFLAKPSSTLLERRQGILDGVVKDSGDDRARSSFMSA